MNQIKKEYDEKFKINHHYRLVFLSFSRITCHISTKTDLFLAACTSPVAAYEMHVNNVRAKIFSGGNLFNDKYYEEII
ncbi:MAG: hypothetical protein IPO94_00300 [Saprospiraceae bacterium]|nr:hypothetical protein [Saprospiraceae bacterium]